MPPVPDVPPVPDIPPLPKDPPPIPPEEKPPAEKPLPPRPKLPAEDDAALPRWPEPFDDPAMEARRLMEAGREDFVARRYGRAAQRFRRAAVLRPREGVPAALLAQALLAAGKYHEASDAIIEAVRLWPGMPSSDFHPLELYGADVVAYSEHLREVARLRGRHPDDAVLRLVAAYQAWFDGRRDEAAALFRGLAGSVDAAVLERFQRALPGGAL
jgi:thioredoxin-like negative regulator of GroEL